MAEVQGNLCGVEGQARSGRRKSLDEAEVIRRYLAGEHAVEIAASLGISNTPVYSCLRRNGVQRRPNGFYCAGKPSPTRIDLDNDEIIRRYLAGESAKKIATSLGVTDPVIYRRLEDCGVERRSPSECRKGQPSCRRADTDDVEIVRRYKVGEAAPAIAASLGISRSIVYHRLWEAGAKIRHPNDDLPADMKRCPHCGTAKSRADGFRRLASICRGCQKEKGRSPAARARNRKYNRELRLRAIAAYGGVCACCEEARWEFLSVDHIDGGGHQHRKRLKKKGADFFRWLEKQGWPREGYQLLCYSCNLAKGFYGTCPHTGAPEVEPKSWSGRRWRKLRAEAVAAYGGACICCGEIEPKFLALDHIAGGGSLERKDADPRHFLLRLKQADWPTDEARLLCHNCNLARGITGYCPCGRS